MKSIYSLYLLLFFRGGAVILNFFFLILANNNLSLFKFGIYSNNLATILIFSLFSRLGYENIILRSYKEKKSNYKTILINAIIISTFFSLLTSLFINQITSIDYLSSFIYSVIVNFWSFFLILEKIHGNAKYLIFSQNIFPLIIPILFVSIYNNSIN